MPTARRLGSAALAVLMLAPLGGCLTPRAQVQTSQAIIEARQRSEAPADLACHETPLETVSPVTVGFAFGDATIPDTAGDELGAAARWLTCNPATPAVIKPAADPQGSDAEKDALARRRAEAVQTYVTAKGVPAQRLKILPRDGSEPSGVHFLLLAEGRRW